VLWAKYRRPIEIGHIHWGPAIARKPAGTEAHYLFMRHAFEDLGYRRWEWKCNNRNEPSKRAAEQFGFKSEGVFRQHMIVKGENRDTAWYSIIDTEWPALKRGSIRPISIMQASSGAGWKRFAPAYDLRVPARMTSAMGHSATSVPRFWG
jgi:Acetyltransferase (GNAT) domain